MFVNEKAFFKCLGMQSSAMLWPYREKRDDPCFQGAHISLESYSIDRCLQLQPDNRAQYLILWGAEER